MIADVSQQAEHKREKYQQQQTHTILPGCKEIFPEVAAAVDFPSKAQIDARKLLTEKGWFAPFASPCWLWHVSFSGRITVPQFPDQSADSRLAILNKNLVSH